MEETDEIKALEQSDRWLRELYLEKIKEVKSKVERTNISENLTIALDRQTEDDLWSLFEETTLTLGALQTIMREHHVLPYRYYTFYLRILQALDCQIKGHIHL